MSITISIRLRPAVGSSKKNAGFPAPIQSLTAKFKDHSP